MPIVSLSSLEQRLAVAVERNRVNNATREQCRKEAMEQFNCSTLEELAALVDEQENHVAECQREERTAAERAEAAVVAVETAVGGAQ